MGNDFFAVSDFPTATFQAEIFAEPSGDGQYLAEGSLTLKGVTVPVTLPFLLELDQKKASMQGSLLLNRLDFGIGDNMPDESNLAFGVAINVTLEAVQQ